MDWQTVITTLGGTAVLVAALAWLSKVLISAFLARDIEKFKGDLTNTSNLAIEEFKSNVQLESQKRLIEYSSLHEKRGQLIAELYKRLYLLTGAIQRVMLEFGKRETREEVNRVFPVPPMGAAQVRLGIDTLDEMEKIRIDGLKTVVREFYGFYGENKIYFFPEVCELIGRFSTLASYITINYENVALKDKDGELYVNPEIKKVWDRAIDATPQLLNALEHEFRLILGVVNVGDLTSSSTGRA